VDTRQSTFEALVRFLDRAGVAVGGVTTAVGSVATQLAAVATAAVVRRVNTTFPLSGGGSLANDLTLAIANATNASLGVIALIGDISGTATSIVVSRINGATAPAAPATADIGKTITATAANVYSLAGAEDIGWSPWSGKVTITGSDVTKQLLTVDLTDATKGNWGYLYTVEFQVVADTADTNHGGILRVTQNYVVQYNSSGIPSIGDLGSPSGVINDIDHTGTPALPNISGISASHSNPNLTLTLTKSGTSASDMFAQSRWRFVLAKGMT